MVYCINIIVRYNYIDIIVSFIIKDTIQAWVL